MPDIPDYAQAGEVFRKTMEEALANIDVVNANLRKEQEKAIDMQIAATDELHRIEREAHQISEAYIEKHRKEYLAQLREEILLEVTRKLILEEVPSDKLKSALELPPKILADAWHYIGFDKLDDIHVAHVAYNSQGRSGTVIFYRNDLTLHFPFEFGSGDTLAMIEVPTPENWEKETKTSLADRMVILEFIARRVIRDQASDCNYLIGPAEILIRY
jgi:S-adenosylmethionine/arginine decarboxylase-like enzyme